MSETAARPAGLSTAAAARRVFELSFGEMLWSRRTIFMALVVGGPVLLAAKIDDEPSVAQTPRDPVLIRHRFMQGLGTGRKSPLDG